jgi:hypothetical protein
VDRRPSKLLVPVTLTAVALSLPAASHAGPLFVGAGYDHYAGPAKQQTRTVMATAGINLIAAGFSITGLRYDDDFVGPGSGVSAGVGFPAFPLTSLRVLGTRWMGDHGHRAWRVGFGPQIGLPTGQRVGLYYSHYADNGDLTSDAGSAELEVPVPGGLTGRAIATYAASTGDVRSSEGSLGLAWKPMRMLELSTDVGLARNGGVVAMRPVPAPRGLRLPVIGGEPPPGSGDSETRTTTETTVLAGVRVWFP